MKPQTAWAIKTPEGHIIQNAVGTDSALVKEEFVSERGRYHEREFYWYQDFYKQGYRCVKVRIEEVGDA